MTLSQFPGPGTLAVLLCLAVVSLTVYILGLIVALAIMSVIP